MGEGLYNLNKMVGLYPWHVLLKLMAPGMLQKDGSLLCFVRAMLCNVLYRNSIHVCSAGYR